MVLVPRVTEDLMGLPEKEDHLDKLAFLVNKVIEVQEEALGIRVKEDLLDHQDHLVNEDQRVRLV